MNVVLCFKTESDRFETEIITFLENKKTNELQVNAGLI